MARSLGIDHGDARIGIALSDELGLFAQPLEIIQVAGTDPLARIAELVRLHRVETVVLGLPLRLSGAEGTATRKVRAFARELAPFLPGQVPIVEVDERLSTVTARERLDAAGARSGNSRDRVDQFAAAVILQDYLDSRQGPALLPDPWADEEEED